jgi:hypothetical protein
MVWNRAMTIGLESGGDEFFCRAHLILLFMGSCLDRKVYGTCVSGLTTLY